MKPINVVSLFDGMSCGQLALNRAGIPYKLYFSSEIDKFAIKVTQANYPDTKQVGDVSFVTADTFGYNLIDLVIGGSPCQGFSFAGKQLNFEDPRSKLFFEYVRVLNELREINPNIKFLLENVNMDKRSLAVISKYLGVFPVRINSALVSGQNRDRWYWTNIRTKNIGLFAEEIYSDIPQPADKGILLKDVLQPESEVDKKYYLSEKYIKGLEDWGKRNKEKGNGFKPEFRTPEEKSTALTTGASKSNSTYLKLDKKGNLRQSQNKASCLTGGGNSGGNHSDMDILLIPEEEITKEIKKFTSREFEVSISKEGKIRPYRPDKKKSGISEIGTVVNSEDKAVTITSNHAPKMYKEKPFRIRRLTPTECERLQTVPDNYTNYVSDTQRYKMLGNGWTVDVIAHILSYYKQ